MNWGRSMFIITFDQTVAITEYYYPDFSETVAELLASLGGALGIWLGVGVLQIGGYGTVLFTRLQHYRSVFK